MIDAENKLTHTKNTDATATQNPVSISIPSHSDNINRRRKESGQMSRLIPVESRGKKRRVLQRSANTAFEF